MKGIARRLQQIEEQRQREQLAREQLAKRYPPALRVNVLARILSAAPLTAAHARIHALLARAAARRERDVQDLV